MWNIAVEFNLKIYPMRKSKWAAYSLGGLGCNRSTRDLGTGARSRSRSCSLLEWWATRRCSPRWSTRDSRSCLARNSRRCRCLRTNRRRLRWWREFLLSHTRAPWRRRGKRVVSLCLKISMCFNLQVSFFFIQKSLTYFERSLLFSSLLIASWRRWQVL